MGRLHIISKLKHLKALDPRKNHGMHELGKYKHYKDNFRPQLCRWILAPLTKFLFKQILMNLESFVYM
jgi:hypothetical protein